MVPLLTVFIEDVANTDNDEKDLLILHDDVDVKTFLLDGAKPRLEADTID